MPGKNQPKSQRAKKVPAGLKKAQQIAARTAGTQYVLNNFGSRGEAYFEVKETPVKRLTNGTGYGWMGRHPADLAILLKEAVAAFGRLRQSVDIQAIAYTGSSGAAIAFPLAIAYELPVIYVRKPNEESHGCNVECNYTEELENYVIVDDFICSGDTARRIREKIKERAKKFSWDGPECIGIFVFDPQNGDADRFQFSADSNDVVDVFKADRI